MNDNKVNLESLLLSYYIKYDNLFTLCNSTLANINSNSVDIYVDLYDMLKPIYTRDIYATKKYLITSSVINLAAHLRNYFWTRHRLSTRIFLVYGACTSSSHKQFCPAFGDDKFRQTVDYEKNDILVISQLKLAKLIIGYINDVYFISKSTNFSVISYDNIIKNPQVPAILITKSKYAYQIPALLNNAVIFRPKKSDGQDVSYAVTKSNVYYRFFSKASSDTITAMQNLNPSLLSLIIAMNGLSAYNMSSVVNINTAVKILNDAVLNNRIINDYNSDIDFVYNNMQDIHKYIDNMSFGYRFYAADLLTQFRIYSSTAEASDVSWIINLNDPNTIKDINNRYFADNPLDLNSL